MESKDPEVSSLKMCALVASSGKLGMYRLQVCNDFIVPLFGRSTCILVSVGLTFATGIALYMCWSTISSSKKFLVAAISATNGWRFYSTFVRL